jgi:hypothetical protein
MSAVHNAFATTNRYVRHIKSPLQSDEKALIKSVRDLFGEYDGAVTQPGEHSGPALAYEKRREDDANDHAVYCVRSAALAEGLDFGSAEETARSMRARSPPV